VPSAEEGAAFVVFSDQIADAVRGGASEAQVQILRDARDAGALTLEQTKAAVADTFACFDASGMSHSGISTVTQEGLERVTYTYATIPGLGDEASLAIADACMNTNSFYVEKVFVMQPISREITNRYFTENVRTRLIPCLRSIGVAVDDESTNDEVWRIATDTMAEISAPYARGELPGRPEGCLPDVFAHF
jgi:hypothetical protein